MKKAGGLPPVIRMLTDFSAPAGVMPVLGTGIQPTRIEAAKVIFSPNVSN